MNKHLNSETYSKNLDIVRRRFPSIYAVVKDREFQFSHPLEVVSDQARQPNAIVTLTGKERMALYEYDDIFEGISAGIEDWDLNVHDFLFCVGFGLGYLPLVASLKFSGNPHIVIVEPNVEMFDLAMRLIDLQILLNYEKLAIFVGDEELVRDIVSAHKAQIPLGKTQVASFGPSRRIYGEAFKIFEQEVIDNIRVVRNIDYTARRAGKVIFSNSMANLPSLFAGPDLGSLRGRFDGYPAVCVAAGPSLDKDIPFLKTVGNRALILCGDSAVHSLVGAGIIPHVVVTTDINPINFEKLRSDLYQLRESILVFSIEANPESVGAFLSKKRIAVTAQNAMLNHWFGPKWGLDWKLPAMTSVGHTALFTAVALGMDPVVMVGMDFAYSSGKSHANGSVFRYGENKNSMISVEGVRGVPVFSLPQLITDRKQIENGIVNAHVRYIDSSLDGALIHGTEIKSLNEIIDTEFNEKSNVLDIIKNIEWTATLEDQQVFYVLERMIQTVVEFCDSCRQMNQKCRVSRQSDKKKKKKQSRRLALIATQTKAFDIKNDLILRILNMLRYDDVKCLNRQMNELYNQNKPNRMGSGKIVKQLGVYEDYFKSLKGAGEVFLCELKKSTQFFKKKKELNHFLPTDISKVKQYQELMSLYLSKNELWQAEHLLGEHEKDFQIELHTRLGLAEKYAEKRMWQPAFSHLRKAKVDFPDNPIINALEGKINRSIEDILERALAAWQTDAHEETRRWLIEYLAVYPKHPKAIELSEKLKLKDQDKAMLLSPNDTSELSIENRNALEQKAENLRKRGEFDHAIGILEGLAADIVEDSPDIREVIGDVRFEQKEYISAEWHYRKAMEKSSHRQGLQIKLKKVTQYDHGKNRQQVQKISEGDAEMDNVKQNDFKSNTAEEAYRNIQPLIEQEKYDEATTALEQLVFAFPEFSVAHNDLGVLYLNRGERNKAMEHYLKATMLSPQNATFQKNMADFNYVVLGRVQEALEIYVSLLKNNPTDTELLLALGHICVAEKRRDDAVTFYQRILAIDPEHHEARACLGELLESSQEDKSIQQDDIW